MKATVGKDHHTLLNGLHQRLKMHLVDMGRRPPPAHDQAPAIEQHAKFDAHDPAMVGHALAPHLSATAPFPYRMQQFDAISIHYSQQGHVCYKGIVPPPMGL